MPANAKWSLAMPKKIDFIVIAGLTALGALVSGCSIRVAESELEGVYVAEYENGTQRLALEKGGKYSQKITVKGNSEPVTNSGMWKYELLGNEVTARISLEDCLAVNDGFGRIRSDFVTNRGGCSFPVERRWFIVGRLRLGPNDASPLWKI